jgi:hypothetical protein
MIPVGSPSRWALLLMWLLVVPLPGCYPSWGPLSRLGRHNGPIPIEESPPRLRIGSLPYPLPLVPLEAVEVDELGEHRYESGGLPLWRGEVSRGILYTEHGGFVDIAHIRNAADLTYYAFLHIYDALREESSGIILVSAEPSLYHITLDYDVGMWQGLTIQERSGAERELAIRLAQRVALDMCTWHEIITWYGYQALPPVPERQSAFSYDDATSHMIGVEIAGTALRRLPLEKHEAAGLYEQLLTELLTRELRRLGAVDAASTRRAALAVRDTWWDGDDHILRRRLLYAGCDGEVLRPWLVELEPQSQDGAFFTPPPVHWACPSLADVGGRDCRDIVTIEIEPNIWEGERIRRDLVLSDGRLLPKRDFPRLIAIILAREREQGMGPAGAAVADEVSAQMRSGGS